MKQEFLMEQSEMDSIININKNSGGPVMVIGSYVSGLDLRENVNNYWKELGKKYGFKWDSVEGSAKGQLYFLAEPMPIEVPKTSSEIAIEKYTMGVSNVPNDVCQSLQKIVQQLESCGYESEGGILVQNVAFLALKQLAGF